MTKLSPDLAGRFPMLDVALPALKGGRDAGSVAPTPFESHFRQPRPAEPTPTAAPAAPPAAQPPAATAATETDAAATHSTAPADSPVAETKPPAGDDAPPADAQNSTAHDENSAPPAAEQGEAPAAGEDTEPAGGEDDNADEVTIGDEAAAAAQQVAAVQVVLTPAADTESVVKAAEDGAETTATTSDESSSGGEKRPTQTTEATASVPATQPKTESASDGSPSETAADEVVSVELNVEPVNAEQQVESPVSDAEVTVSDDATETKETSAELEVPASDTEKPATETESSQAADDREPEQSAATESNSRERGDERNRGRRDDAEQPSTSSEPATAKPVRAEAEPAAAAVAAAADAGNSSDGTTTHKSARSERIDRIANTLLPGHGAEPAAANAPATTAPETGSTHRAVPFREAAVARLSAATQQVQTAAGTDGQAAVDRAKFIQRIQRAFHLANERGGEVKLRLSPPELGNLYLEVTLDNGVLTAHVEAELPSARTLLLENISVLRERLAEQDIRIERFDVDLADRSQRDAGDGRPQDSAEERRALPLRRHANRKEAEPEASAAPSTGSAGPNAGQLNVVI